ncbi:hypothetical protein J4711_14780 [Staphylococcus epidermidis]|nr:hypothetical protein [Staphylococcus epidermidis]
MNSMSYMPPLQTTSLPADAVEVGRIADAWGIKGWFKVYAFSSAPRHCLQPRVGFYSRQKRCQAIRWNGRAACQASTAFTPIRSWQLHLSGRSQCCRSFEGCSHLVAREHFPKTEDGRVLLGGPDGFERAQSGRWNWVQSRI